MIIVLEGPDGVGKSTLADAILRAYPGEKYRMNSGPPPDDEPAALHYASQVRWAIDQSENALVVFDRLHIGELVYAPLLRGGTDFTADEASVIDMMLDAAGACMIHCTLDRRAMVARLHARDGGVPDPKSGATVGHAYAIRASFVHKLGRESGGTRVMPGRWLIREMDRYPDDMAAEILGQAEFRQISLRMPGGWIGPCAASLVLALPSSDCASMEHLSWIAGQLRTMGILNGTAVIAPSVARNGRTSFPEASIVVGLGARAEQWLSEMGVIPDHVIRHGSHQHEWDDDGADWRFAVASSGIEIDRASAGGSA